MITRAADAPPVDKRAWTKGKGKGKRKSKKRGEPFLPSVSGHRGEESAEI
jgi:hypothetical protein